MAAAQTKPIVELAKLINRGCVASGAAQAVAQDAQAAMLEGLSWPSAKQEAWRHTSTAKLQTTIWRRADQTCAQLTEAPRALESITGTKLVFVDGHYHAGWSSNQTGQSGQLDAGVWIGTLKHAEQSRAAVLRQALGSTGLHRTQGLAALNSASLQDAAVVHIKAQVHHKEPLHVIYLQSGASVRPTVVQPRTLIVLEPYAQASVWEHYLGLGEGGVWTNGVSEVCLAEGAQLEHIMVQAESATAMHTTSLSATLDQKAHLAAFVCSQGGASARHEMHIQLDGDKAEAHLAGLYMADASAHHDIQLHVHHNKPCTQSSQNFRGILRDHTTGVFSGTVYVAKNASKSNAKQLCRSLLLSPQARAHAQPRLEILTDDVKCAHGATFGALDDNALFYLQSRGLEQTQSQQLLTYAYAAEALADAPKSAYASLAQRVRAHMGLTDLGDSVC